MSSNDTSPDPATELLYRRWTLQKLLYLPLRFVGFCAWIYIAHGLYEPLHYGFSRAHWRLAGVLAGILAVYVVCSYLWQCPRCRHRFWIGWRVWPFFNDPNLCPKCNFQLVR